MKCKLNFDFVFELLVFNDALRRQVWLGERLDLKCAADFRSMYDDGIQKVRDGITTVEELVRTIPLPEAK